MKITPRRAFMIANAVMAITCVFFVYMISTSVSSERSAELVSADLWLAHLETQAPSELGEVETIDPTVLYPGLKHPNPFMRAVIEPIPTPTPTPMPTPTPIPLSVIINSWTPVSMDETVVTILDQQSGEEFDMELNGAPKMVPSGADQRAVKVIEINLDADPPFVKMESDGDTAMKVL